MHAGQVQTKKEIERMVGGLRGFRVTDTKCQGGGTPRDTGQCEKLVKKIWWTISQKPNCSAAALWCRKTVRVVKDKNVYVRVILCVCAISQRVQVHQRSLPSVGTDSVKCLRP